MRGSSILLVASLGCGRLSFEGSDAMHDTGSVGAFGDSTATEAADAVPVTGNVSCAGIKMSAPASADGIYMIMPDEALIEAYCDMTTDGGGWTLVLSYVHRGGTNPALRVRTTDLPLLASETLGADESATASWGHAGTAMLSLLPFSQLRFSCRSGAHARVLDFRTSSSACMTYLRTGSGVCTGLSEGFAALPGHTAMLPQQATHVTGNAGDDAMTNNPFFKNTMPKANWVMSPTLSWACDEQAQGSATDTIHRVWVR